MGTSLRGEFRVHNVTVVRRIAELANPPDFLPVWNLRGRLNQYVPLGVESFHGILPSHRVRWGHRRLGQ
jgi:hypothetical protein